MIYFIIKCILTTRKLKLLHVICKAYFYKSQNNLSPVGSLTVGRTGNIPREPSQTADTTANPTGKLRCLKDMEKETFIKSYQITNSSLSITGTHFLKESIVCHKEQRAPGLGRGVFIVALSFHSLLVALCDICGVVKMGALF